MQDKQQFEQLIMQYTQLKNGAEEIHRMLQSEDYDGALTLIKSRESLFLSCKCIRKYLELNPEEEKILNTLLDELKKLEQENIKILSDNMSAVQRELKKSHQIGKIQQAYDFNENYKGSMINYSE